MVYFEQDLFFFGFCMPLSTKTVSGFALRPCLVAVFFIQIASSLAFSVLYSTLMLYLQQSLGMQANKANNLVGVFLALNYLLHILGGAMGGKYFSNRVLFCLGMFAQTIGCLCISVQSLACLYGGLTLFLVGSGLNVTCLNCILNQRYSPEDGRRESVFIWNYSGMTLGFFIGYTLGGFYQINQNYQTLFLLSSLGNVFAILLCFLNWPHLRDLTTSYSRLPPGGKMRQSAIGFLGILMLPFFLYQAFQFADWSNGLIILLGVLMLGLMAQIAREQTSLPDRNKIKACAIFMLVSAFFWMLYQIGPMGLTFFIAHNVDRTWYNWIIPPQWFSNSNNLCIILGGPIIARIFSKLRQKGRPLSLPLQFTIALMAIGVAFLLLNIGVLMANQQGLVHPGWVLGYYLFQSLGEIFLSPVGYAMIGLLVPSQRQGLTMGVLMMYCGVGAALASYCSNGVLDAGTGADLLATNANYAHLFLCLGLSAIVCGIVLGVFIPKMRRWVQTGRSGLSGMTLIGEL